MVTQELWVVYFKYIKDKGKRKKINEIMEREEGIAMASEVLMTISKDEAERARLMSEYKYQMDMQSKLVHAKRVGIKEGIVVGEQRGIVIGEQRGREVRSIEVARNALMNGFSVDQIHIITGLDTDKIKNLQLEVKG
jgi:predicted transposase/invertase (TIGR01784 family)